MRRYLPAGVLCACGPHNPEDFISVYAFLPLMIPVYRKLTLVDKNSDECVRCYGENGEWSERESVTVCIDHISWFLSVNHRPGLFCYDEHCRTSCLFIICPKGMPAKGAVLRVKGV